MRKQLSGLKEGFYRTLRMEGRWWTPSLLFSLRENCILEYRASCYDEVHSPSLWVNTHARTHKCSHFIVACIGNTKKIIFTELHTLTHTHPRTQTQLRLHEEAHFVFSKDSPLLKRRKWESEQTERVTENKGVEGIAIEQEVTRKQRRNKGARRSK